MNKKKNFNKGGIIVGLFLMYIWTYIFLVNTSDNKSNKDYTYINKVFAELKFFQDQIKNTNYNNTLNTLYNKKWSSSQSPIQWIYSKWLVIQSNTPIFNSKIKTQVSPNITILPRPRPPRRHSH